MFDFTKYFAYYDMKQNLPVVREYIFRATKDLKWAAAFEVKGMYC